MFASRIHARALTTGLLHQDHGCNTTNESFCFHNNQYGEIRCKLDSTENPRSFEKYPTPTCLFAKFVASQHCATAFFLQVLKFCTEPDQTFLYISIFKTHITFVWKNSMLVIGVCLPHTYSSAGRRFAASRSRLHHYQRIVSFPQQKFR